MAEVEIINDISKKNKLKDDENFLSKKDFTIIEKIDANKYKDNLDSKNDNLNMNMNITSVENKENIDDTNIIANTEVKNNDKKFNIKTNSVLQEKLKKIFLDREKRKFEYNKQEIPENLKYHSDSTSSDKEMKNENNKKCNEDKKIYVMKRHNSNMLKNLKENDIKTVNYKDKVNNSPNNEDNISKDNNQKLNNKRIKSFNQKIIDNYLTEITKKEKDENDEKKQNKKTAVLKDIIEKLKTKKIEKNELCKKENEERIKEVSKNMDERKKEREKTLKKEINEKDKINNKNTKPKNMIPTRDKKRNYKSKNLSKNENFLLPHKTYRDENDDEINSFNFYNKTKRNNSISKPLRDNKKEETIKSKNDTIFNRKKKTNSIDITFHDLNKNKKIESIISIEANNTLSTTNKNLQDTKNTNNTINIYKPKKPALAKAGSRLKIDIPSIPSFNKITSQMKTNFFKNNRSTKNIFSRKTKYNFNGKNIGKIPYVKKSQLMNINNMNNTLGDINNDSMIVGNNNNTSCLDINNVNNLNSSFDSLMKNNNDALYGLNLNNNFYNNNMNLLTGRITHTSFLNNFNNNYENFNRNNLTQMQLFNYNNRNTNFSTFYNNSNQFVEKNNNSKNYSSLNIEDLLILEEKLYEIIKSLNNTKMIHNECFEFWNYYFNCSLYCKLEKLFTNMYESNEIRICINYLLMTVLICYDYSFNINIINNSFRIVDNLLRLNRENLIFIFQYILTKISTDSRDNIWVIKLKDLVNSILNMNRKEYDNMNIIDKISYNSRIIMQNLSFLLQTYKTENNIFIFNFLQNLHTKNYEDIDIFFREKIFRVENINGSVLASIFLKENHTFKTEPAPYLKTINRKPYSLILDLDETLVHFKINPDLPNEGVLRVRPGIIEFLESVDKYYELIIFTAATQEYADLLIDAVEDNKIYFEHRLYRQHTVIIGNDFVKDLSRVGRPLDKIAIVDNMPQNFRLQKENGINIKAFWGEEAYDTALIDLGKILVNIAKDKGDIRNGIKKYKDEILKKVTSNISKH